ncbi:MAG TPA: zf-HC2 domain-containing protein, partial [Longimicrobium sp.]|nr:zf-HC2 domain-containing protein [Longimicrobium sp.]
MTHEQALERLDDFASGELPDIERVLVQRHVDACDDCRAEVEAIHALLAEAATLPRAIAPPRDLWAGIAPRLEARATPLAVVEDDPKVIPLAPRRRHWQPPRWAMQIAAALVLVAGSSAITARIVRENPPRQPGGAVALNPITATPPRQGAPGTAADPAAPAPTAPVQAPAAGGGQAAPTAFAAFRPAERDYQSAIADLQRVLDGKRGQMAPETAETLERNLRIIDAAIAESRAALEKDPNSRELLDML